MHKNYFTTEVLTKIKKVNLHWLWISFFIIVLDQLTKYFILKKLVFSSVYPVMPFFNLTLVGNRGAAFSFLSFASGWQNTFFIILGIIISGFVFVWLLKDSNKRLWLLIGLSLILGGAIGNLCDRFHFGYVVDFIDVYFRHWHWPVFNVADSAISMGILLLIIDILVCSRDKAKV